MCLIDSFTSITLPGPVSWEAWMYFYKALSPAGLITDSNSNAPFPYHDLCFVCSGFRGSTSFIETRPHMRSEQRSLSTKPCLSMLHNVRRECGSNLLHVG